MSQADLRIDSRRSKWSTGDVFAMEAMHALPGMFVPWTSFSLRPAALQTVLNEILVREPRLVLELGSGASTIMIARLLRQANYGGRLVSIESDSDWAKTIVKCLERDNLAPYTHVVDNPLRRWAGSLADASGEFEAPLEWYDVETIVGALDNSRIEMLLVDGPPGGRRLSRYPAVPELSAHLSDGAVIMLDDARRPAEQEIARQWSMLLEIRFTIYERMALAIGRRDRAFNLLGG